MQKWMQGWVVGFGELPAEIKHKDHHRFVGFVDELVRPIFSQYYSGIREKLIRLTCDEAFSPAGNDVKQAMVGMLVLCGAKVRAMMVTLNQDAVRRQRGQIL